ncbi:hypothetical protein TP70_02095 [Staphylococcus microti]|uniref:Lipoprotein n=1 Tax=Staphylococcus microti TaxID=569857 RepID=A0ABR5C9U5_9STAP|nr:hypothetical protein TP70_02095 [Staphylococcus microti]PNZ77603.1 hypothetical protein CD132_10490 [Staphylococcus microti]
MFDYLIAGINQGGGDASLITFQQPIFNEQGSGLWVIEGNNKSGVGTTYRFVIDQDGTVSMYNDYDHELIDKQHVTLN